MDALFTLFKEGWEVIEADERVTRRYGREKVVSEVATRKSDG